MSKAEQIDSFRTPENQQLLRIYCWYRFVLACLLTVLPYITLDVVGTHNPSLYQACSWTLTVISLLTLIYPPSRENPLHEAYIFSIFFVDTLALILLVHAGGGLGNGQGYLLIIVAATASILLPVRLALLIAALGTISILVDTWLLQMAGLLDPKAMFLAAVLGVFLFGTSLLFQFVSRRVRQSHSEILQQKRIVKQQQLLSQAIVERMQTGAMIINQDLEVTLSNRACDNLLFSNMEQELEPPFPLVRLKSVFAMYQQWQMNNCLPGEVFFMDVREQQLRLSFTQLESHNYRDTLVFVEETRRLSQQAQQMKLASLGRLTASIAHEIRNPLGAISHAAQLLEESEQLSGEDHHLTRLIHKHSLRANDIIENVQQLSRRRQPHPRKVILKEWLASFCELYRDSRSHPCDIAIETSDSCPEALTINIDPSQLQQVLTNLLDNGLHFGHQATQRWFITLRMDFNPVSELASLHVIDEGPGVAEEHLENLFEPFYTTNSNGTGLGLYLAKELCFANQAFLSYNRLEGKSCFTISFAHLNRLI